MQNMVCGSLATVQLESDKCLQQEQDHGGHDLDPMLELAAKDDELDQLCHSIAEDLSTSLIHSLEYAQSDESTTMPSCSLPPSTNLRKLYLHMISNNAGLILETLAVPLKQKLLQNSSGAALLEGSWTPIKISQGWTSASDCLVVEKEAFCVGRHTMCDVQLLDSNDLRSSRIHLCIFNLPGGILVVDGWSISSTSVALQGDEQTLCNDVMGSVFLVPHGKTAKLLVGSQRLLINPAEEGKSSPDDYAQGCVLKRLPRGNGTASGPHCAARQGRHRWSQSQRVFIKEILACLEQDVAQK